MCVRLVSEPASTVREWAATRHGLSLCTVLPWCFPVRKPGPVGKDQPGPVGKHKGSAVRCLEDTSNVRVWEDWELETVIAAMLCPVC